MMGADCVRFVSGSAGCGQMDFAQTACYNEQKRNGDAYMQAKNVLVTGAAGGMGSAACDLLTDEGYRVWGIDRAEPQRAHAWRFIRADLTDAVSVASASEAVSAEAGGLYAIVHMAGVYDLNSLVEMPEADWSRIFGVNLFGPYRVNRAFAPLLGQGSRILLISSELAPLDPLPFTGIYGITKAALEKYAFSLRMELQLLGIGVSIIRPGAVDTQILDISTQRLDAFRENTQLYACNAERFRKIVDRVEARKVPPETIARAVRKALEARHPKYVYNVNRNPLLLLLNALPARLQTAIIRTVLKP